MSYCRFQNTYGDLQDCYEALQDKSLDELSETEKEYAKKLIKLCRTIADDFLDDEVNKNFALADVIKSVCNGKDIRCDNPSMDRNGNCRNCEGDMQTVL